MCIHYAENGRAYSIINSINIRAIIMKRLYIRPHIIIYLAFPINLSYICVHKIIGTALYNDVLFIFLAKRSNENANIYIHNIYTTNSKFF